MKYYHMIIEPLAGWHKNPKNRREYISARQGAAPEGWKCVAVCGYHEEPKKAKIKEW